MSVLSAIQDRRSIRKYSNKAIEEEKLENVLEAARLSPSAMNRQDWKFIVVKDSDTRKRLTEDAIQQPFVGQAPIILVCCGTVQDSIMKCGQPRYTIDLSIATSYMILEAHAQGLGTCWLGSFDEKKTKEILEIPEEVRVVSITPLGYPEEAPKARPRKEIEEIVSYDRYK